MVHKDIFSEEALASWITRTIDTTSARAKRANQRAQAKAPQKVKKGPSKFTKPTKLKAMPWKKALARAGPDVDAKSFFSVLFQAKKSDPSLYIRRLNGGSQ